MSEPTKPVKKIPIHLQSSQNRIYIKRAKIVNHDSIQQGDVYIEDGTIRYVGNGADFVVPGGSKIIDAAGKYLIPGGIDPHTHFELEFGGTVSVDDFYKGTKAAVCGATTTVIDFVIPKKGESLLEAYDTWRCKADGKVVCDYGLHVAITWWSKSVSDEMKILCEERGVNSFKVFMAYKGLFQLNDSELYEVFERCKELGAVAQVHAENGDLIAKNTKKLLDAGVTGPEGHELSRPEEVEAEAVHRACVIAHQTKTPLYVNKITSNMAAEMVSRAKRRGYCVYGETLASSLGCTKLPAKQSLYYITSPPIRADPETSRCLLKCLALDELQTTGSDNCTFNRKQKELGKDDFSKIPNGVNGVEDRMSVVWEKGVVTGLIDPQRFVAITSTNAAKIFNLYPKKGRIEAGSDADVVIWDGQATRTISATTHHQACDFNIFEGMTCHGVPEMVIVKGRVSVEGDLIRVAEGYGQFVSRPCFTPYVYDKINGKQDEDATGEIKNGLKHLDFAEEDQFDRNYQAGPAFSVSGESVISTATNHTARAPRPDGQRNMQSSSFSISEEICKEAHRSTIRVRNPPGGASSGLW